MNELRRSNLWWLDILMNKKLEDHIIGELGDEDSDDMELILKVMKEVRLTSRGIETNDRLFKRLQHLNWKLNKDFLQGNQEVLD